MKIFVVGDFHGKFPRKIKSLVKKEKIDLVISIGDYLAFTYRKLWFKHCYGEDIDLWEVIGKKKFKKLELENIRSGKKPLNGLNKLGVPVYSISGNVDRSEWPDGIDFDLKGRWDPYKWASKFFKKMLKKYPNVIFKDYSYFKFGDYVFICGGPSSFPGKVKSKNYKRLRKKLDKLFKKFRKENKEGKVIFVSHNVPYNTKLDKIVSKEADTRARGKHYGSKLVRRIIDRYRPVLHFAGHIHERMGKQKLGRTLAVNCGSITDGNAVVVDIPEKGRIKVKFIK